MNASGMIRNERGSGEEFFEKFFAVLMTVSVALCVWQAVSFAVSYVKLAL